MTIDQAKDLLTALQQTISLPGKDHDAVKVAIEVLYSTAKLAEKLDNK